MTGAWLGPAALEQILAEIRWVQTYMLWGFGGVCLALNFIFLWMWRQRKPKAVDRPASLGMCEEVGEYGFYRDNMKYGHKTRYAGKADVQDRADWKPFDRSEIAG